MMFEYRKDDTQRTTFHISDNYGNQIELSPEQTFDLLNWLTQQSVELFRLVHPESTGDLFDEPPPGW